MNRIKGIQPTNVMVLFMWFWTQITNKPSKVCGQIIFVHYFFFFTDFPALFSNDKRENITFRYS